MKNRIALLLASLLGILEIWSPALGPIDDHVFIESNKWPLFIFGSRFYPMQGFEQFLIQHTIGLNLILFYLVNGIELILLFLALEKIVNLTLEKFQLQPTFWSKWLPFIALLTPPVTTSYFRLLVPERLLVLCISSLVIYDLTPIKKRIHSVLIYLPILFGLFLKEPTFLLVGGLSFFRIIEKRKNANNFGFLALSIGFVLIYLIQLPTGGGGAYGHTDESKIIVFLKNLGNFALNDPWVVFFALPLFFKFLIRQRKIDAYLALITGYLFIFLILGIFQEYYLLPIFPFLIVVLIQYQSEISRVMKPVFFTLTLSCLASGIHQISRFKNESRNFSQAMDWLSKETSLNDKVICYLGLNSKASGEILGSTKILIHYKNPSMTNILSLSSEDADHCDYLIDSPYNYSNTAVPEKHLNVFSAESSISFPALTLKTLVKYILNQASVNEKITNQNLFADEGFYIYQKNETR